MTTSGYIPMAPRPRGVNISVTVGGYEISGWVPRSEGMDHWESHWQHEIVIACCVCGDLLHPRNGQTTDIVTPHVSLTHQKVESAIVCDWCIYKGGPNSGNSRPAA